MEQRVKDENKKKSEIIKKKKKEISHRQYNLNLMSLYNDHTSIPSEHWNNTFSLFDREKVQTGRVAGKGRNRHPAQQGGLMRG